MDPKVRLPLIVVGIIAALALGIVAVGRTVEVSDEATQAKAGVQDNELVFKFACSLSLAVAERLDTLVVARLDAGTLAPSERAKFRQYHADYERGKDICPPITRDERDELERIIAEQGGKLPAPRPGR